jgi:Tol biopolymer transport system component
MLSPDGKRVATSILDPAAHTWDLWVFDVSRELRTRFTFEASRTYLPAIWSPDGSSIAFQATRDGKSGIYRKAANLSGSEELLYTGDPMLPTGSAPDGKTIVMARFSAGDSTAGGIFALPLTGERKPIAVATGARFPNGASFSPDGRWVVYGSIDSQRGEIYVVPYPGPGGKLQISANGGVQPRWRSDGKEIFYVAPDGRLTAVEVRANGASLEAGRPQTLFGNLISSPVAMAYDVAPGGQRFLVAVESEVPVAEPLTLVQNWTAGLKK